MAFKKSILDMKVKVDEENFDEAESQAYRCWTETSVPSDIATLFQNPHLSSLSLDSPPFFHLLEALRKFTLEPPHTLPLTSTLPDMKANTDGYIHLQKLYKARAEEEKARFKSYLTVPMDDAMIDLFVKNAHALRILAGKKWGALDADQTQLGWSQYLYLYLTNRNLNSKCRGKLSQASLYSPLFICTFRLETWRSPYG